MDNQDSLARIRPLLPEDARRSDVARPAKGVLDHPVMHRFRVSGFEREPAVEVAIDRVGECADGSFDYDVVLKLQGIDPSRRATLPPLKGKAFRSGSMEIDRHEANERLVAFAPEHLAITIDPADFVRRHRTIIEAAHDYRREPRIPTTVFAPDDRYTFRDTHYPWSTIGLVETNRGAGSGVVIGPRHLLTVSHVIDWNAPPGFAANWVRFTPSYYDGGAPFGVTFGTNIYWIVKEDGDTQISSAEAKADFAVVVLDQRIGDLTGWMGARAYDDDWDPLNVWSHVGYPGDLNSGERPAYISPFKLNGSDDAGQALLHVADVFPGQSGGPMFAWWPDEVGPRAVAVQSWQNSKTNGASGGRDMFDLVVRARSEFA